jgi:hypothetical protein
MYLYKHFRCRTWSPACGREYLTASESQLLYKTSKIGYDHFEN